jgi:mutator protein MutT
LRYIGRIEAIHPNSLEIPPVRGVVAVLEDQGRLLVIRRAAGILAGGAWCFPGGAIESGESPSMAVTREVFEELGVQVTPVQELWEWRKPDGRLILTWWRVELSDRSVPLRPAPAEVAEVRWAAPQEILELDPLLAGNREFLETVWPALRKVPG